jgi:hypothetical protein
MGSFLTTSYVGCHIQIFACHRRMPVIEVNRIIPTQHPRSSEFVYPTRQSASERDILCTVNPANMPKGCPITLLAQCLLYQGVYLSGVPKGYRLRKMLRFTINGLMVSKVPWGSSTLSCRRWLNSGIRLKRKSVELRYDMRKLSLPSKGRVRPRGPGSRFRRSCRR